MLIGWLIGILGTVRAQSIPVLDPSMAVDTSFSSIFEDVEIIPLETNRESVFGIVKQLLVTDQYFVILDPDTDAILFFDKKGRYLAKYRNRQSRYRINFIQLDRQNNALLVFSQNKNYNISASKLQDYLLQGATKELPERIHSIRLYLHDLNLLRSEELKTPAYLLTNPIWLGHNQFAFSFVKSNAANKDTLDYQLQVVDDNGLVKSFFPYNKKTDSVFNGRNAWQCSFSATLNDSIWLLTKPFDSVVYSLTPTSIAARYKVIVPRRNVPEMPFGMESVSFFDGESFIVSSPNSGRGGGGSSAIGFNANNIGHVFSLDQFLFFSIRQSFIYDYYIYDKKNGSIYNYKELKPDSSNYMFPLTGAILASDQSGIYQSVTARTLFRKKKNAAKLKWKYQASLDRFYNSAKETDNPVLIRIKPKEQTVTK